MVAVVSLILWEVQKHRAARPSKRQGTEETMESRAQLYGTGAPSLLCSHQRM